MIVKDELDVLERFLARARRHVSEVNVYDTGWSDGHGPPSRGVVRRACVAALPTLAELRRAG
jgi:hypothetical protein